MDAFMHTTPFGHMFQLCLVSMALTWLLSVITREYSWVDRWWSVGPAIYAVYVAWFEGFGDLRLNIMALLVVLWSARLTFNFARKGGYAPGGEDYRWAVLQERLGPVGFQALNITFISPFQCALIWAFTAPVHTAWEHRGADLGALDVVGVVLFVLLLIGEAVADEQMWAFQQDKKRRKEAGEVITQPFFRSGLYRVSRHPNYFCELGQWWVLYLFAVAASGAWLHWTLGGVVALTLLFDGSVRFGESISASKYPAYADYKRQVSRIIPWLPHTDEAA
jgi:steroid 5-alpha reductase family enzyme